MASPTMRAAFVRAPWQVEVREVPVPEVVPGWVLVRVEACGLCGTDLHIAGLVDHQLTQSGATKWQGFGHEVAGVVAAIGPGVANVKEGDTVVLESGSYCGLCDLCRNGRADLCNKGPNFWSNQSMGFADYILAPAQACVPYSELDPIVACLAEPLGVAIDMVTTADIRLGNEVLVLGLGPIGLMAIPLLRRMGAQRIYAANRSGGRRSELATALGADEVIITRTEPLARDRFRKDGVDRALVSASPAAIAGTLRLLRYGGILSFIGITFGAEAEVRFDANEFHFNKLQLRASHAAPALFFPLALDLLRDDHVPGADFVSHTFSLDDMERALLVARDAREEVIKVVVTPNP